MPDLLPIGIVAILILLNALFVAAEFAIIGAPKASIERKAKLGERLAIKVRIVISNRLELDRYIATAQLGITLASLGLGMYGEHMLAVWLEGHLHQLPIPTWFSAHAIASTVAIGALTYIHIVIGEMIPKSLALQDAEQMALWIARPMQWIQTIFFPLVLVLNHFGDTLLKYLGMERSASGADVYHSSDELEYVFRESEEGGLLRKETSDVLQSLLEFGDLVAREVMVPRVKIIGIPLGANNEDIARILDNATHTRYVVYDHNLDHIVGMVHIKDFLRNKLTGRRIELSDIRVIPFVPEAASLEQVLQTMRTQNAQMVAVLDEYGGTAGLITLEDLFEEIVGEIDENDDVRKPIRTVKDGSFIVSGLVRLDEISERVGINLDHDEVDTVSGLILTLLGRPPALKDRVEYRGMSFKVTEVDGHAVGRCTLKKARKSAEQSAEGKALA